MDLLWMMMVMMMAFLVHVEAENTTEVVVKVKVGDNTTLTCSDDNANLYWYVQFHGNIRWFVGRTYSRRQEQTLYCPTPTGKYQLSGHTLLITNTTAEDCRSYYYCGRKSNSIIVSVSTFHLVPESSQSKLPVLNMADNVPPPPPPPPPPSSNHSQLSCTIWLNDYITYGSFALNGALLLVTTGLVAALLCLKKRKRKTTMMMKKKKKKKSSDDKIYENLHKPKGR